MPRARVPGPTPTWEGSSSEQAWSHLTGCRDWQYLFRQRLWLLAQPLMVGGKCPQRTGIAAFSSLSSGFSQLFSLALHVNSVFFLTLALILPSVADLPCWILAYWSMWCCLRYSHGFCCPWRSRSRRSYRRFCYAGRFVGRRRVPRSRRLRHRSFRARRFWPRLFICLAFLMLFCGLCVCRHVAHPLGLLA